LALKNSSTRWGKRREARLCMAQPYMDAALIGKLDSRGELKRQPAM
jgi:hypothetical protein